MIKEQQEIVPQRRRLVLDDEVAHNVSLTSAPFFSYLTIVAFFTD